MEMVRLAQMAMATRFEIVLHGDDPVWLRAVGEEALREIVRLEAQLSFYRPSSDISRLNANAFNAPVHVDARLFDLLVRAETLWRVTRGAFDLTVGPLMRCWGLTGREGRVPPSHQIAEKLQHTGMHLVALDHAQRTVRFLERGVEIDLGGIGKGFAIDEALRIMREAGVGSALIHGGTSSVAGIGVSRDGRPWRVAIGAPQLPNRVERLEANPVGVVELQDASLSVSDVGSKWFEVDGVRYGHVIDPRTGQPSDHTSQAAVSVRSAADADALSTALLVASDDDRIELRKALPDARLLVLDGAGEIVDSDFALLQGVVRARSASIGV